jgi:hypothetical protein
MRDDPAATGHPAGGVDIIQSQTGDFAATVELADRG